MNNTRYNYQVAFSSHKKCFICRRKKDSKLRLHDISKKSIISVFSKYNIIIKKGTRVCYRHLDNNKELLEDELVKIPTKSLEQAGSLNGFLNCISNFTKKCLENQTSQFRSVFHPFKNISELDDDHCKKITKWTKEEFLRFSNYIKRIRNTKNRTKEEMIALYRFIQ